MVDVACNDSEGSQRPSSGNRFFILASTVIRPVTTSTVVVAETCERPAMAVAASDGLSDVMAERTALRAMSFSRNVSRHTDNVARSNSAHKTTTGAMRANSTVACPLFLRRGVGRTIKYVVEHSVKEGTDFSGSTTCSSPCNEGEKRDRQKHQRNTAHYLT